ncbi:hypothetical protein KRP22_002140 [Phytophthora ramorum]|nr:hypothetical protein KRP22_1423 [Phytophthora ramorum]
MFRTSKEKTRLSQLKPPTRYAGRKEHKRLLVEQVEKMQNELDRLKFVVLVNQGEIRKATQRTQAENAVLLEFIQKQHLTLATTQAALAGHVQRSLGTLQPLQSVVRLGSDRTERRAVLLALRDSMLDNATRYLAVRRHGLAPRSSYSQEERLDSPDGDYCLVRFDVLPLYGESSKAVFDATVGVVLNAEMYLSELFGNIAIREDNDFESTELAQLRQASFTSSGATVESNTVLFSKFVDECGSQHGNYGVMATDFVDYDELYPYRNDERVRRDSTTVVMVQDVSRTNDQPPVVVLTRWTWLKLHSSNTAISKNPETEMKESSICWGDTAAKVISQQLAHSSTVDSP